MLAVEPPLASRAHVHELRDDHLLPVVRGLKSRPLLIENHRVPIDAVADSDLCSDRGRHPLRTVCRQQLIDLCLLNLGQSHSCPRFETVSVWRTPRLSGRRLARPLAMPTHAALRVRNVTQGTGCRLAHRCGTLFAGSAV